MFPGQVDYDGSYCMRLIGAIIELYGREFFSVKIDRKSVSTATDRIVQFEYTNSSGIHMSPTNKTRAFL